MKKDMEVVAIINQIRMAATKLKGGKLKRLHLVAPAIDALAKNLNIEFDEALMFVAVFDRQCMGRTSDIDDLSNYFDVAALDIMPYVPQILRLVHGGVLEVENRHETSFEKRQFRVTDDVYYAIIEQREIVPYAVAEEEAYTHFDLCKAVSALVEERGEDDITTRKLMLRTLALEKEHADLPFVKEVTTSVTDVESRVLFYEMCKDFFSASDGGHSDLSSTMKDMYDNLLQRAKVKKQILDGTHPLIAKNLIEQTGEDDISITQLGVQMLFGDSASAFISPYSNLDRMEFVQRMCKEMDDLPYTVQNFHRSRLMRLVTHIENANPQLTFVTNLKKIVNNVPDRLIFYLACERLLENDTVRIANLLDNIYIKRKAIYVMKEFKQMKHALQKHDLVELEKGTMVDDRVLALTDRGKELFLEEELDLFKNTASSKDLIQPENIKEKRLFFEKKLQDQLGMLTESLSETNYANMRERLNSKGLPVGVAVLLYGLPGTGKTESVMQLARQTGRPIMHVDISETKTCWFGESEKLIKEVFNNYRRLCKKSKITPILLFNEADAVFAKRKDSNFSSVAQTENAIQNIILEEMEKLEGILVATTNMAENLDSAFERRFLFKIRYDKPTAEAKQSIWLDKLPSLSESDAMMLARDFDFSGGEIDNIVRKALMKEVITGQMPSVKELYKLCTEEKIGKASDSGRIGFN